MEPEPATVIATDVAVPMVEEVTEEPKAAVTVKEVAGLSSSAALVLFKVKVIKESGSSMDRSAAVTSNPEAVPVNLTISAPSAAVSEPGSMETAVEEEALRTPAGMVTVTEETEAT